MQMPQPNTKHPDQFIEVFASNYKSLVKAAMTLVDDQADAEDVVQQAALRAWQRRQEINAPSKAEQLRRAHTMVRCQVLNFLKQRSRERSRANVALSEGVVALHANGCEGHHDVDRKDLVATALEQLPDGDKSLLGRHLLDGLESRQLAKELGRSQSSLCNSLRRAKRRLAATVNRLDG